MQIQVVAGTDCSDAKSLQDRVSQLLSELGNDHRKTVQAEAYGANGLVDILEVRAADGQGEILVLNCSRLQIQAVLDWQSCAEDTDEFEHLVLHLVRLPDSTL
ncbi:hypothetical protein [Pseudomonas sp. FSL W5-0299]|uniref:hypothetical protein n=1 Tax=Pseudomonas sp. FSL W5-0299 TaxID=1917484 RepID=UPI000989C07C|nr:hypothetical protein [Pseudomonas sp. FSL W5-0299]OOL39135.1 hypothetical protein BOO94_04150 [Pseudomonas sp. FSL W5-0299]